MEINWKQKLSSRKFWIAIVGFVSSILYAFNIAEAVVAQVVGIIMSGAFLIAYIFAEGWIDASRVKGECQDYEIELIFEEEEKTEE